LHPLGAHNLRNDRRTGGSAIRGRPADGLTLIHVTQLVNFITIGRAPEIVLSTGHPTRVVFALDLSLVVPIFILGAVWLWRGKPWGIVTAGIMNVKGAVYNLVLTAATLSAFRSGAVSDPSQIGIWGAIGIGCLISAWLLLRGLEAR
jgi:hypothetical protein